MTQTHLKILLVESSVEIAQKLAAVLGLEERITVVGECRHLPVGLRQVQKMSPNLILMGVPVDQRASFEFIHNVMVECPTPIVCYGYEDGDRSAELAFQAVKSGALTWFDLPISGENLGRKICCRALVNTLFAMAEVKTVRRWKAKGSFSVDRASKPESPQPKAGRFNIVAIAASTGGPQALVRLFSQLPDDFPFPILVVQHIGNEFLEGFVQWLSTCTKLSVEVAKNGSPVQPGTIYFSTPDRHLGVGEEGQLLLSHSPPIGGFRPSADYLFETAAHTYGVGVLAVILSGMGADGVMGLSVVKAAGGYVLAQDETSSVVFGMPKVAIENGVVDKVLPLQEIVKFIQVLK